MLLESKKEGVLWVNIKYNNPEIGMGSYGKFLDDKKEEVDITLRDAVIRTKEGFQADVVKVYGDLDRVIRKVAICIIAALQFHSTDNFDCIIHMCEMICLWFYWEF